MISVRTESERIDVEELEVSPREWHQLCLLHHANRSVHLLLDGQAFLSEPYPSSDPDFNLRHKKNTEALQTMVGLAENLSGHNLTGVPLIILGSLVSPYDSPVGKMADLRAYGRILRAEELEDLSQCGEDNNSSRWQLEVVYKTQTAVLRTVPRKSLCQAQESRLLTFSAFTWQAEAEALCDKLGGALPSPQSFQELTAPVILLTESSSKSEMYFWLSNSTNFTALGQGEGWCLAQDLRHGGTTPMRAPCDSWARDMVCYIPQGRSVFLLHQSNEMELFFGDVGQSYLLLSDPGFSITHENRYQLL